jgi:hypothetical protein
MPCSKCRSCRQRTRRFGGSSSTGSAPPRQTSLHGRYELIARLLVVPWRWPGLRKAPPQRHWPACFSLGTNKGETSDVSCCNACTVGRGRHQHTGGCRSSGHAGGERGPLGHGRHGAVCRGGSAGALTCPALLCHDADTAAEVAAAVASSHPQQYPCPSFRMHNVTQVCLFLFMGFHARLKAFCRQCASHIPAPPPAALWRTAPLCASC